MDRSRQKRFVEAFFRRAGPAARTLAAMFDKSDDVCFYIKDLKVRIVAINRSNCELSNFRDCWDAIGRTSDELFPPVKANSYRQLDYEVLESGKSVIGRVTPYPADDSRRFMISDVHPIRGTDGRIIGTTRVFRLSTAEGLDIDHLGPMRRVFDHIHTHYADDLPLPQLAALSCLCESSFRRAFAKVFGTTPAKYITIIRLNAARHLLETTDYGLAVIARKSGFFDDSHLIRAFRAERGMTPGEYRSQHLRRAGR